MLAPQTPAILQMRHAVRAWSAQFAPTGPVTVALSGGADSLALTAAAVVEVSRVHAVIVDHQLQTGSAAVAATARAHALALGCATAEIVAVQVSGPGGLEAAARRARYAALDSARGNFPVLLGHTLDDQAETVLLGLARGSGGRSIQGMSAFDAPWGRPLLTVRRAVTRAACTELGIDPYEDPHNSNPDFVRVRLRTEVLPLLEEVLGGGVAPALARTAAQLREDGHVLDALALDALAAQARAQSDTGVGDLDAIALKSLAPAVRRRVLRAWLLDAGATSLTDKQLRAVDALIEHWRGQGGVAIGGGGVKARLVVARRHGRLNVGLEDRSL